MRGVIYGSDIVANADRRFGSASVYYLADFYPGNGGDPLPLAFTAAEIERAAERARKNPEDIAAARRGRLIEQWKLAKRLLVIGLGLLAVAAMALMLGCVPKPTLPPKVQPPLVTCAASCRLPCATAIPAWRPPDPSKPEAFDYLRPQVVAPLASELRRCDVRRADCWACLTSIERAGAIRLPGADGR